MQEIIERLTQRVGLSPDQAKQALETIAGYVKEKFPMLEGAVDQMFKGDGDGKSGGGSGFGSFGGFGG